MIVYRNRVYFSGRFEIGCCFTGPAAKKQFLIPEQAVNGGITENNLSNNAGAPERGAGLRQFERVNRVWMKSEFPFAVLWNLYCGKAI